MKNKTLVFLFVSFSLIQFAFGQSNDAELYPKKYTFEKAKEFQKKGEYEKAIWFCINLFPVDQAKTIKLTEEIKLKLDTVDIESFIKKSFALYSTFDPTVTTFNNGMMSMNGEKLKEKGSWGDQLIMRVTKK